MSYSISINDRPLKLSTETRFCDEYVVDKDYSVPGTVSFLYGSSCGPDAPDKDCSGGWD